MFGACSWTGKSLISEVGVILGPQKAVCSIKDFCHLLCRQRSLWDMWHRLDFVLLFLERFVYSIFFYRYTYKCTMSWEIYISLMSFSNKLQLKRAIPEWFLKNKISDKCREEQSAKFRWSNDELTVWRRFRQCVDLDSAAVPDGRICLTYGKLPIKTSGWNIN